MRSGIHLFQILLLFRHSSTKKYIHLSELGHFLKGSSATIGLNRVKDTCEKIQYLGAESDKPVKESIPIDDAAAEIIANLLKEVRLQYKEAKDRLIDFFENRCTLDEL